MPSSTILLVADELGLISSVKRVLAREGYECILATNAADAIIAFGHSLPGLVLLQPGVESDRGQIVLEELRAHPDSALLRVVLLGESIVGFASQVEPLPIEPKHLMQTITEILRQERDAQWTLSETKEVAPAPAPKAEAPEEWRSTGFHRPSLDDAEFLKKWSRETNAEAPMVSTPSIMALEAKLFGDLTGLEAEVAQEIEAAALVRIDSSLALEAPVQNHSFPVQTSEAKLNQITVQNHSFPVQTSEAKLNQITVQNHSFPVQTSEAKLNQVTVQNHSFPVQTSEAKLNQITVQNHSFPVQTSEAKLNQITVQNPALPVQTSEAKLNQITVLSRAEGMLEEATLALKETLEREAERARVLERGTATVERQLAESQACSELLIGDVSSLRQELKEVEARAREEKTAAAVLREKVQILELAVDHHRSVAERLQQQLQVAQAERAAAADAFDEAKTRLEASLAQNSSSEDATASGHQQQLASLAAQHAEALEAAALTQALERETWLAEAQERDQLQRNESAQSSEKYVQEIAKLMSQLDETGKALRETEEAHAIRLNAVRAEKDELALNLERAEANHRDNQSLSDLEFKAKWSVLQKEHAEALAALRADLILEHQAAQESLAASHSETVVDLNGRLAALQMTTGQLAEKIAQLDTELQAAVLARETARVAFEQQIDSAQTTQATQHELAQSENDAALQVRLAELESLRSERDHLNQEFTAATAQVAELSQSIAATRRALELSERAQQVSESALAELEQQHRQERLEVRTLTAKIENVSDEAAAAHEKTRILEQALEERVRQATVSLMLPGERLLGVARTAAVDQEGLTKLFSQLVTAQCQVRVDLGVPGGERQVYLKQGAVVGVSTSFETEGLIERARRDGLIDSRQERELRQLKTASAREQLEALQGRGWVRETEIISLLQRYTEGVVIEAFGEPLTNYRLLDTAPESVPEPQLLVAAVPRPTLPMLAESLRRSLSPDVLLDKLGGIEARCAATDSELDLRGLGFSEKERRMLARVDGETTVEGLSLGAGLKPETAFRALLVAHWMGVVAMLPALEKPVLVSPEIDVKRLESKYEEVQEADYFTILGLSRSAGTEEVARAFRRLAEEFSPLRYAHHPDAGLQQRARVVQKSLEEAAHALEDEQRRTQYARHLMS
jgi:CheY-like chemotaxis protein